MYKKSQIKIALLAACLMVSCNAVQNATATSSNQPTTKESVSTNATPTPKESASTDTTPGKEVKVRELVKQAATQISDAKKEVIKDQKAYLKAWSEVTGVEEGAPKVDFEKEMVLAVFMGEKTTGGFDIQVTKAELKGKDLIVEVTETSPDPSLLTIQIITSPAQLVAVDKVEGEVKFETKEKIDKGE